MGFDQGCHTLIEMVGALCGKARLSAAHNAVGGTFLYPAASVACPLGWHIVLHCGSVSNTQVLYYHCNHPLLHYHGYGVEG